MAMKRVAAVNVGLHVLGLVLGATVLQPGSIAAPLESRTAYIAEHALYWQLGWGVWMLSALAFVAFMALLVREVPRARPALLVAVVAGSFDLVGDAIQMFVLP